MHTLPAGGMGESQALTVTLRGLDRPERAAERAHYIAQVFAAHHRALRAFIARSLRNEEDVADTVQEVFLRVAQLPDPSKLDLNPRAYLLRIAEHLLIDRAIGRADRSLRREQAALQRLAEERRESRASDAAETAASEDLRRRAAELVASLDLRDRELLTLRLRGEEWAAIANATGLNTATCRQRWHRLLERLATAIGESEPTDRSGAPRPSAPPAG